MVQSHYYRHSGQFALASVLAGTIAATAVGAVVAVAYAALILYIPFAGLVTCVLSVGFGIVLGLATAATLRLAKVRHEGVAFLSSATAAGSSFYVCWSVWTYLLLRQSEVDAHLTALAMQPDVLWQVLGEINAAGAWSLSGFTPTGALLWVLWGAEALLILAPAVLVPAGVLAVPFCERCDVWCEPTEDVARLASVEPEELEARMDARDLSALEQLGPPSENDDRWIRVDLHTCPSCDNLHTMTLKAITASTDGDGERQQRELEVVTHLLLSTDEAHRVRALQDEDAVAVG